MSRRSRAGGIALAVVLSLRCFGAAHAQAIPGSAPGSQTGDSGASYAGLASSPEANLFTGVAQTSIPIEVPPGRLGLAPVLALAYSSSAGASQYGEGWSLALPRIHRSTRHGVPRYDDSDTYVLEMPGAMVELERIPGSTRGFRAQIESAYFRIGFDDSANYWKVIDKLGVSFTFGTTSGSRTGRGPSRDETFAWLLERIEDPAGNRIDFSYRSGGLAGTSTGLPEIIRYGANAKAGLAHFAEAAFTWSPIARSAPARVSYREGRPDVLDVRLAAINTRTHGLAARRYDFSHELDPKTGDLRLVGATLTAFAESASDDTRLPSTVFVYAPTLHEGWPAPGSSGAGPESYEIPDAGLLHDGRNPTVDILDLNGDALVDHVDTNTRPPTVKLGTQRGFAASRPWNWPVGTNAPRFVREIDGNGNLLSNVFDLDGDSFADLVDSRPAACGASAGQWCVWRGSSNGFSATATRWLSPLLKLRTTDGGGARVVADLVDVDADGRLDLVDSSGYDAAAGIRHWNVYRNSGTGFVTPAVHFAAPLPWLARTSGARLMYGLFDINADSLPDLVVADAGTADDGVSWNGISAWQVYLNDGKGLTLQPTSWSIDGGTESVYRLPNFLNLHASDGTMAADLFDITGDGRPDLVRRGLAYDPVFVEAPRLCEQPSRCFSPDEDDSAVSRGFCCFNLVVFVNTGASFSQPVAWSAPAHGLRAQNSQCPYGGVTGCAGLLYDFDFFDVDGDGLVDFVERYTAAGKGLSWLVHPHPASASAGVARPNLLLAMRNGIGGETMLRYHVAASTPGTSIPFPHWIVVERELRDSIYDQAPLRTSLTYRGGLFDPDERELRGFAMVQQIDPVGTVKVREYHQDRRRAGRLKRTTNLEPAACVPTNADDADDPCSPWRHPLGATDYEWPSAGAVLLQGETDVPYHNGSPVENLRRTTTYRYDAYGNVAERRTVSPMSAGTVTTIEYDHRVADGAGGIPGSYLVAKPWHASTREDGRISPLIERSFEYLPSVPALLSAASTCASWSDTACTHWVERSFEYDTAGNMVVARAPEGATTRTTFDANALFAISSTDSIGLQTTSVTEPRTGLVVETIAPNGMHMRSRYDGLGRLLRTWGPGTSRSAPLRRLAYAPGDLGGISPRTVVTDALTGQSAMFFDGLGRSFASKRATSSSGRSISMVSGLRHYDERGLVVAETLPFESANLDVSALSERFEDAPAWLEFSYDRAGRLAETRAPDGSTTRVDRSAPGILRTDDANTTSGQYPGSVTLELFDGLGHRLLRDSCTKPPLSSAPYVCPPGKLARRESWVVDGLGRIEESRTEGLGVAAADAVTRIERDGLGNRVAVFHSNAGTWRFRHDDNGRLVEVLKPDGSLLSTSYDTVGRIRRRRGPDSRASYRYHKNGGGIGKVRRIVSRSPSARSSEKFEYDDRGRTSTRQRRVSARGSLPADISVAYQYDDLDRRIATRFIGWPDGDDTVHQQYDAFGRTVAVWTDTFGYVQRADYDGEGRLVRVDYGSGLSALAGFESRNNAAGTTGHLACLRTTVTASANAGACSVAADDLDDVRYAAYDPTGNLLAIDDPLHEIRNPLRETHAYSYDGLGRLVTAEDNSSAESFAFDPLGNLTRLGESTLEYTDPLHPSWITQIREGQASVRPFVFDTNGRRVSDGEHSFAYDDSDRLVEVALGAQVVARYGYNDSGERIVTRNPVSGSVSLELGDGVRVTGERVEREITFGGRTVAVEERTARAGAIRRIFLHYDHQQSVRLVTDGNGEALEYSRYNPFGTRRQLLGPDGRTLYQSSARRSYTGHVYDADSGLLYLGARHYDPGTGSFLTLDPAMQFASPYAYSSGNPILGRDPDGAIWELTATEFLALVIGGAAFIDSIATTGDLGHSLTAGIFAGFSVYFSTQLSTAIARPLARAGHEWLQMAVAVASDGFQTIQAAEAIEDGRYAGGIVAAGMLAASLIGIESANDPGESADPAEAQERHGIRDRGMVDGKRVIEVNGICATRPGCFSNTLIAARENLRVLFGGQAACVGGCEHVAKVTRDHLDEGENVLLRCNSFGTIKCLGALKRDQLSSTAADGSTSTAPRLSVQMSGAPLLRPPTIGGVTYQVNLFDPVVWVGTAYSTPLSSDVVLGRNWWVPAPVIVHHTRMYEKPFHEALLEFVP